MVTINSRPGEICFSQDPIIYKLHTDTPPNTDGLAIEVALFFCPGGGSDYTEIFTQPCYPDAEGNIYFYPSDIVDCYLEFELPVIGSNDISDMINQVGKFYINYRERIGYAVVEWQTDVDNICNVIKGEMPYELENNGAFFSTYLPDKKPFLTWQQSGRLCAPDEVMYLFCMLTNDPSSVSVTLKIKTTFTDSTFSEKTVDFSTQLKYHVYCIPAGMMQRGITAPAGKTVYYYELSVMLGGTVLAAPFRFEIDNRPLQATVQFNFQNSLGGLDSIRLLGSSQAKISRDVTQASNATLGVYNSNSLLPQISTANVSVQKTYSVNTGYLNKQELEYLQELLITKRCWLIRGGKWWPVLITITSVQFPSTNEDLYSMQIEYQYGFRQNSFLPDNITF